MMISLTSKSPGAEAMNSPTHSGVTTTPIKLEMLALKMAAGRLPRAMDTITTEAETVDGEAAKKNMPNQRSPKSAPANKGRDAKTISGKNKKAVSRTTTCTYQLARPTFGFATPTTSTSNTKVNEPAT